MTDKNKWLDRAIVFLSSLALVLIGGMFWLLVAIIYVTKGLQ